MATDPRYTESMGFIGWCITITLIGFAFVVFGTLIMIFLPFIIIGGIVAFLFVLYANNDWNKAMKKRGE